MSGENIQRMPCFSQSNIMVYKVIDLKLVFIEKI